MVKALILQTSIRGRTRMSRTRGPSERSGTKDGVYYRSRVMTPTGQCQHCHGATNLLSSVQQCQHYEAMNLLLKSAKYSDLTLVCEGQEFHVHRAVLCPKSTFFDAACSRGFKVCAHLYTHDQPLTASRSNIQVESSLKTTQPPSNA
jgi:BTB/POZ domain-containing protein